METSYLHDKQTIRTFLLNNPFLHLYEIGDLDDFFWPYTTWYALDNGQGIVQIALFYAAKGLPILLYFPEQASEKAGEFLHSFIPNLPRQFYAHLNSDIAHCLRDTYYLESHGIHYKMALQDPTMGRNVDTTNVIQLTTAHIAEVEDFYQYSYPGNWFDARMLETGYYYGIKHASTLVCVAGVHVYLSTYKVAVLGNVATHPDARGQGLATTVCARLCQVLQPTVDNIGLNVKADNHAAISCYKRLGFERIAVYEEYVCTLK